MLFKVANVITGAGPEEAKKDEGASLTSVLETPALRVELALLVLLCIDAMRSDLTASFDPDKTHETISSSATTPTAHSNASTPANDLISFDAPRDEKTVAAEIARTERRREIESTQIQALRRSALTFFDKWRAAVMGRICDVLCVRGDVVRQAKTKRKQLLEQEAQQNQGISSLIDFDQKDPFATERYAGNGTRKHGHYDVIETKILALEEEKRVLILHCLLLLLLSLEHYPAHSRVLLLHLASSLELETDLLAEHEKSVAQGLLATAASQMDAEETTKKQASNNVASRKWKVGLAAVGGAVLIGVTGGLAAPLLVAGLGTVMGGLGLGVVSTYLGALAGSSVLVGSLFGAYGAKMTGRMMEQYAREVQDFEFVPVTDPSRPTAQREQEWADEQDARDPTKREQHRLRVCVGISGWLNSPSDVNTPWEVIDAGSTEPFALRFELDSMLRLGNSLDDVLFSYAWDGVAYTVVSRTILGALYAGLWPLGLLKVASVLDNPFSVAIARADKAGKVLAHALIDGVQGKRPVTLMGYSIGARVIYSCLLELAEQHAFGLVESVVLMGTPAPSESKAWRRIRGVVGARVVNVYSTEDYILGYLYRSTKLQIGVAGLQEVKGVFGIENVNMSKLVNGHDKYRYLVGSILARIGFGDLNFERIAEQEHALELAERKKQQLKEKAKKREANKERPGADKQRTKVMSNMSDQSNSLISLVDDQDPLGAGYSKRSQSESTLLFEQPSVSQARNPGNSLLEPSEKSSSTPNLTESRNPVGASRPTIRSLQSPPAVKLVSNPSESQPDMSDSLGAGAASLIEMKGVESRGRKSSTVADKNKAQPKQPAEDPKVSSFEDHSDVEGQHTDDSDGGEEISHEFGELSMVEPVPMDDNDYGLV